MQSQINLATLPQNVPSMCIPRVFSNIPDAMIHKTFDELGLGEINKIHRIPTKDDKFKCIRIEFKRWYTNSNANLSRERLLTGKEIKVIYDDPWFWKIYAYRNQPSANKEHSHKKEPQDNNNVNRQSAIPIAPCLSDASSSPPIAPCLSITPPQRQSPSQPVFMEPSPKSPPKQRGPHREPREQRAPQEQRGRRQERKFIPRSPSCSPPIQEPKQEPLDEQAIRETMNEEVENTDCYVKVNYGDIKMPPPLRRNLKK
jgi:hypothetical protein